MVADSSHLVSAFPRTLALWARMRVCENNQRECEKYADARIREREFARINRKNTIYKSQEHNKDENSSLRDDEDTKKTRIHRENMKKTRTRERGESEKLSTSLRDTPRSWKR